MIKVFLEMTSSNLKEFLEMTSSNLRLGISKIICLARVKSQAQLRIIDGSVKTNQRTNTDGTHTIFLFKITMLGIIRIRDTYKQVVFSVFLQCISTELLGGKLCIKMK